MTTCLVLAVLCCPTAVYADDDLLIRSSIDPVDAWVGQRVTLQIDVLSNKGWAQISRFGDLELPGAYVIRTEGSGARLQEEVEGTSYAGQRYEVSIYPQRAGVIDIPALPVEVRVKTWGADATETLRQEQAPAATIDAALPPGAEGITSLVSTSRLVAQQQWSAQIEEPQVGDALKRTVTLQADDVSGMAFAPLGHGKLPGIGTYRAEPLVEDRNDRGTLSGRRTETVTYVFERDGSVQIPDISLTWWNLSTESLETIVLPGEVFVVAPGPLDKSDGLLDRSAEEFSVPLIALAGVLVLALGGLLFGRPMMQRFRAWSTTRQASEQAFFQKALKSIRSRDGRRALRDIMRWLDRTNTTGVPAQLLVFARAHGTPEEQATVMDLISHCAQGRSLEGADRLIEALKAMRARSSESSRLSSEDGRVLPALN